MTSDQKKRKVEQEKKGSARLELEALEHESQQLQAQLDAINTHITDLRREVPAIEAKERLARYWKVRSNKGKALIYEEALADLRKYIMENQLIADPGHYFEDGWDYFKVGFTASDDIEFQIEKATGRGWSQETGLVANLIGMTAKDFFDVMTNTVSPA